MSSRRYLRCRRFGYGWSVRVSDFTGEEVVETDDFVLFWKPPAVFGQWTPSTFVVGEVTYSCAEQFMMAAKARLFGDEATFKRILKTDSPREHKALGRKVTPFDQATWEESRLNIVVLGNMAKFRQNPAMCAALLATGDKTLVEASPVDRIWGIGLRADDARAFDRNSWRGLNLLGEALMQVRETLRAEA